MASVKRFVQDEAALFLASQKFVDAFSNQPDPIVEFTGRLKSVKSRVAWTILGTDLFQNCSYKKIKDILKALYQAFPEDRLWSLPVPSGKDIESAIRISLDGYDWPLLEHVSGIFWSVGLFIRRHENVLEWLETSIPEEIWRDLGEIYFMGKHNPRPKVSAAIYRFASPQPAMGLGLSLGAKSNKPIRWPDLPLTMGSRRFLAILGPASDESFSDMEPAEKQVLQNEFCVALCPQIPYKACHSLQFFLEEGEGDFICREKMESCTECPIFEYCNYAVQKR